jgi:hypothetical protein
LGQRPTIDADFINAALEEFTPNTVAANAYYSVRSGDGTTNPKTSHLDRIDKNTQRRAIVRAGYVGPGVSGQAGSGNAMILAGHEDVRFGKTIAGIRVKVININARAFLDQYVSLAVSCRRMDPGFDSHPGRKIEQSAGVDRYQVVEPIETQRPAKLTLIGPGCAGNRAGMTVAGSVRGFVGRELRRAR